MKIQFLVSYIGPLALISTACSQGGVKEDFSTPMATAQTYFTAMKAGDTNIFQRAALGTAYQKDWMAAYVRSSVAGDKLQKAATARFGPDETDKSFGEMLRSCGLASAALAGLTNADPKLDGTNATITFKPDSNGKTLDPLKLQKTGDEWKVVLGEEINHADFDKNAIEAMAEAMAQCAADIDAGRYQTATEASQDTMKALMTKMQNQPHASGN